MRHVVERLLAVCLFAVVAAPLAANAQLGTTRSDTGGANVGSGFSSKLDPAQARKIQAQRAAQKRAAAAAAAKAAADPAKAKAEADAMAARFVTEAGAPCTITGAKYLGSSETEVNGAKATVHGVETSCQEGLGFILLKAGEAKPEAADCVAMAGDASLTCTLPANATPAKGLQPFLVKAGSACVVADARLLGEAATAFNYEIKCEDGLGQVLQVAKPLSKDSKALTGACLMLAQPGQPFPCKLTTEEANAAKLRALAATAPTPCTANKQRYVTGLTDGSDYWELACEGGTGVMMQVSAKGQVVSSVGCARASTIAGGCKLTDASAGVAQATTEYAAQAKAGGINCAVSKFIALPPKNGATEAVELACGSAPGAVLVVKDGKPMAFNCGRSLPEGYACGMGGKDAANIALTAQLKAKGKAACDVTGTRPLASATYAYVEVACADGSPGFLIRYPRASNEIGDVYTCGPQAQGVGGCQLPSNKKA